jgi:ABC-type amino acid transport substrate-binding protein
MQFLAVATLFVVSAVAVNGVAYSGPKHLVVVTTIDPPYMSQAADGSFSGFNKDLLDLIAGYLGFTYTITVQPGNNGGVKQADGTWNGVVRTLIDGKADVAATDLALTEDREAVIDYPTPFNQFETRILVNVATGLTNVKYAVFNGNVFQGWLSTATDPALKAIWANVQANNGLVATFEEGVAKVTSGGWAFIDDGVLLNAAAAASNGKLQLDPQVLQRQFQGFAVPQDSPLRESFSGAIEHFIQSGDVLANLKKYKLAL